MLNEILRVVFKVVFFVLRWLSNILLLPLKPIFLFFPRFENFLTSAINFFDTYIANAIAFAREVVLNMTGFPQEIITASVDFALLVLTSILILKMIAFVFNIWRTFKGGKS